MPRKSFGVDVTNSSLIQTCSCRHRNKLPQPSTPCAVRESEEITGIDRRYDVETEAHEEHWMSQAVHTLKEMDALEAGLKRVECGEPYPVYAIGVWN